MRHREQRDDLGPPLCAITYYYLSIELTESFVAVAMIPRPMLEPENGCLRSRGPVANGGINQSGVEYARTRLRHSAPQPFVEWRKDFVGNPITTLYLRTHVLSSTYVSGQIYRFRNVPAVYLLHRLYVISYGVFTDLTHPQESSYKQYSSPSSLTTLHFGVFPSLYLMSW